MEGFINNDVKLFPTHTDILKHITDQQIFEAYIPNIVFNKPMNSPLGEKDNRPSFSVFWSTRYNKFLFKEHRYGWFGDCFDFVQRLFGYTNLTDALSRICIDFKLTQYKVKDSILSNKEIVISKKPINKSISTHKVIIKITVREWEIHDIEYWNKFGINKEWATMANIYPIKYYFIDGVLAIPEKYSYAYLESKDGEITYKIYQPFSISNKWISNNNGSVWELWNMLPDYHNILVITKSRKDALSIMCTLRIPAVSLQAEGTIPKIQVINELKERFKNIVLLYDNDYDKKINYGRIYGLKLSEMFSIRQIEIPSEYKSKDYSELVNNYGEKKATEILLSLIKNNNYDIDRKKSE